MNHRCAVIGVAANVTQRTPPRVGQTDGPADGQTKKFNTICPRFTGNNCSGSLVEALMLRELVYNRIGNVFSDYVDVATKQ